MASTMRLDKYLADMGIGTRTEVKNYIKKGRIKIGGVPVLKPEFKVDIEHDAVEMDGSDISYVQKEYFLLNKPAGVISASSDPKAKTVIDLIYDAKRKDLFPVGRLDKDTEGLLLITNDGELSHKLLSPKKHVDKTYYAKVLGRVTKEDQIKFQEGLVVDEELTCLPADLKLLDVKQLADMDELIELVGNEKYEALELHRFIYGYPKEDLASEMESTQTRSREPKELVISEIEITIREGKYHQIKRMFEAVGKRVVYLKRLSMGSLVLDESLAPSEYRALTREEIEELYR